MLGIWHTWERREIYTGFLWENMKERNKLEHLVVDTRTRREEMLKKLDDKMCTGYMLLLEQLPSSRTHSLLLCS